MSHPAQLLSDPRRPYVPQAARANSAPTSPSAFSPSALSASSAPSASPTAHSPLPTASTTSLTFSPTPGQSERLFTAFADPFQTLASIARDHNTTLEAITLWMSRPDIQQRLANMRAAFAERTRFVASNYLPGVSATCHAIVHEFNTDQAHMCFNPTDPNGHEIKRRNRDTARKTGMLLLHLAKYYDIGIPTPRASSDSPATPSPGTPTLRAGSSSPTSQTRNPKSDISGPTPSDPPTSPFPLPTSSSPSTPDLATLIASDPALAAHLVQAIANKQSQTLQAQSLAPAHPAPTSAPPSPAPNASPSEISNFKSEIPTPAADPATSPTPHVSSSEISNLKFEILPTAPNSNSAHQSEIPNPQSEIAPSPTSATPNPKSNIPPDPSHPRSSVANSYATPVTLTISARPLSTAAGTAAPRAP